MLLESEFGRRLADAAVRRVRLHCGNMEVVNIIRGMVIAYEVTMKEWRVLERLIRRLYVKVDPR